MKAIHIILPVATAIVLAAACNKKDVVSKLDLDGTGGKTNVKIVNTSAYAVNYGTQLKVNDTRVSNTFTYCTPFPGGGLNTGGSNVPWYLSVEPGVSKIGLSVPKAGTNTDSIALFAGSLNFAQNTYYTAYIVDTSANTKLLMIGENPVAPVVNTSRYKFMNLIPNLPSADLYWGSAKVASAIPYAGGSGDFVLNKNDTGRWYVRTAGSAPTAAPVAVYPGAGVAAQVIPNQRILTVFSRGYVGTTGNRIPAVSLLFN